MDVDVTHRDEIGIVCRATMGSYAVRRGAQVVECGLAARPAAAIVVGDRVQIAPAPYGPSQIVAVLPRRNQLARRGAVPRPGAHAFEQVFAANVDLVVAVLAVAQPALKWNLLDRYLTLAETLALPALVCLTKADLRAADSDADEFDALEFDAALAEYRGLGYGVALTSAATGAGLDDLRAALRGRTAVLIGKSGVGKTSLLNALEPGLGQRVAAVSRATGKGRHTTARVELFPLAQGGALIDTPGTREFGLWDLNPDDLAGCFPEMRPWVGRCKFRLDCRHDEEPGCAIRQAVLAGQISARRYHSYLRLRAETED